MLSRVTAATLVRRPPVMFGILPASRPPSCPGLNIITPTHHTVAICHSCCGWQRRSVGRVKETLEDTDRICCVRQLRDGHVKILQNIRKRQRSITKEFWNISKINSVIKLSTWHNRACAVNDDCNTHNCLCFQDNILYLALLYIYSILTTPQSWSVTKHHITIMS